MKFSLQTCPSPTLKSRIWTVTFLSFKIFSSKNDFATNKRPARANEKQGKERNKAKMKWTGFIARTEIYFFFISLSFCFLFLFLFLFYFFFLFIYLFLLFIYFFLSSFFYFFLSSFPFLFLPINLPVSLPLPIPTPSPQHCHVHVGTRQRFSVAAPSTNQFNWKFFENVDLCFTRQVDVSFSHYLFWHLCVLINALLGLPP